MRTKRPLRLLLVGAITAFTAFGMASASASSANISRSYKANQQIANGNIVSLDVGRAGYIVPSNITNDSLLVGVSLDSNDSLLAVNATDGQVQVATSGSVSTLVSTLNGDIGVGDEISVSPFNGIGIKAGSGAKTIGLAQTPLNSNTEGAGQQQVTDKDGAKKTISVGYIKLNIAIGDKGASSASQLNSVQRFGRSLTGKTLSTSRLMISLVVALAALVTIITLTYASIYGSIISVGRNPLAKYAIFRATGSVISLAVLTAIVAGATIFLLLKTS